MGWSVVITALWQGGRSERAVAIGFIVSWAITALTKDHRWTQLQWGGFAGDTAFFVLLVVVALRSRRYWPLWAAGFQLLAVITHAAMLVDRQLSQWAYITANVIWSYLLLFSLAYGTWSAWRERRQLGAMAAALADPGPTLR